MWCVILLPTHRHSLTVGILNLTATVDRHSIFNPENTLNKYEVGAIFR